MLLLAKYSFPRSARKKQKLQERLSRDALQEGKSVVVDNTNPKVGDRLEMISIAKEFSAVVKCYFFKSTVEQSLDRNKNRTGRAFVPRVGILSTAKYLVESLWDEGYDELSDVTLVRGSFVIAHRVKNIDN